MKKQYLKPHTKAIMLIAEHSLLQTSLIKEKAGFGDDTDPEVERPWG